MIQERLKVTKQGALNLVGELDLREMTGRGMFRGMGDCVVRRYSLLPSPTGLH
ncbi:helix-turn-helix domain-containing protein [Mesorhizobium sp. M1217]